MLMFLSLSFDYYLMLFKKKEESKKIFFFLRDIYKDFLFTFFQTIKHFFRERQNFICMI